MHCLIRYNGEKTGEVDASATHEGERLCCLVGDWGIFIIKCWRFAVFTGDDYNRRVGTLAQYEAHLWGNVKWRGDHLGRCRMSGSRIERYEYNNFIDEPRVINYYRNDLKTAEEGELMYMSRDEPSRVTHVETHSIDATIDITGGPPTGLPFVAFAPSGFSIVRDNIGRIVCDG